MRAWQPGPSPSAHVLRILWLPDGWPEFSHRIAGTNWLADDAAANFKCLLACLCVGAHLGLGNGEDASRDGAGPFLFLEPEAMVLAALGLWSIEYFWSISAEEREACLVIFLG